MGLGALAATALTAIGVGAETAAIAGPILAGAAIGTVGAAVTGGNIGLGALTGGITGGFGELGGAVGDALDIGTTGGDILAGTAGGLIGAGITGGSPLTGALIGAGGGAFNAATSGPGGLFGGAAPSPTAGGPGAAPAATVAPASVPISSPDVTAGLSAGSDVGVGGAGLTAGPTIDALSPASPLAGASVSPGSAATGGLTAGMSTAALPSSDTIGSSPSGASGITTGQVNGSPSASALSTPSAGLLAGASPGSISVGGGSFPTGIQAGSLAGVGGAGLTTGNLTAGAPAATGTAATGGGTISNFFNNPSFSTLGSALSSNAVPLIAGGGLLFDLTAGQSAPPGLSEIESQAGQLQTQSQQLESFIQSGKLPTGLQATLNQATNSAMTSIRSQYASRGMSGSSAEAQDLQNAQTAAAGQGAQIAIQLLQQGVSESQISAQLYETIMQESIQQDQELSSGISNFATSLALTNLVGAHA